MLCLDLALFLTVIHSPFPSFPLSFFGLGIGWPLSLISPDTIFAWGVTAIPFDCEGSTTLLRFDLALVCDVCDVDSTPFDVGSTPPLVFGNDLEIDLGDELGDDFEDRVVVGVNEDAAANSLFFDSANSHAFFDDSNSDLNFSLSFINLSTLRTIKRGGKNKN